MRKIITFNNKEKDVIKFVNIESNFVKHCIKFEIIESNSLKLTIKFVKTY